MKMFTSRRCHCTPGALNWDAKPVEVSVVVSSFHSRQNDLEIIAERTLQLNRVKGLDLKVVVKELVPMDELKLCG